MKRLFLLISVMFVALGVWSITIIPSQYKTVKSHDGIIVKNIVVNDDKSLTVTFENVNSSNYSSTGTYVTNAFNWYLSYKGKQVSDYYSEAIRCGRESSRTVYYWPGKVPSGYEKYITVQMENEKASKDRRDE